MVLKFGSSLFENRFENEEGLFTLGETFQAFLPINEGFAGGGSLNFISKALTKKKKDIGTSVSWSALNYTGAIRSISVTITNATKGTTLFSSGAFDIGATGAAHDSHFFSRELIAANDTITITFGGAGVGTGGSAPILGNISGQLTTIFEAQDESD